MLPMPDVDPAADSNLLGYNVEYFLEVRLNLELSPITGDFIHFGNGLEAVRNNGEVGPGIGLFFGLKWIPF